MALQFAEVGYGWALQLTVHAASCVEFFSACGAQLVDEGSKAPGLLDLMTKLLTSLLLLPVPGMGCWFTRKGKAASNTGLLRMANSGHSLNGFMKLAEVHVGKTVPLSHDLLAGGG